MNRLSEDCCGIEENQCFPMHRLRVTFAQSWDSQRLFGGSRRTATVFCMLAWLGEVAALKPKASGEACPFQCPHTSRRRNRRADHGDPGQAGAEAGSRGGAASSVVAMIGCRTFIAQICAMTTWPFDARAQQPTIPIFGPEDHEAPHSSKRHVAIGTKSFVIMTRSG